MEKGVALDGHLGLVVAGEDIWEDKYPICPRVHSRQAALRLVRETAC